MGSRKQSSNQLAKQANLKKRVASHILETMSCDESMESSQENKDNNTGKEATSKNAVKRQRKSARVMERELVPTDSLAVAADRAVDRVRIEKIQEVRNLLVWKRSFKRV